MKRFLLITLILAILLCSYIIPTISAEGIQYLLLTIPSSGGVQLSMKLIQEGSFIMGTPQGWDSLEEPQHRVTITKAYYIGVYEVTQEQWSAVMGTRPSYFGNNPTYPVESISWNDCQRFIARINTMGLGTFRLPTEAEWEYACRAGSTTMYPWGDDYSYSKLSEYAWYGENSNGTTHPVGQKIPNAWGLYDMHGNVDEWCSDWYDKYSSGSQTDPKGPSAPPTDNLGFRLRIKRGGSWYDYAEDCRSSDRDMGDFGTYTNGFRLVRGL